MSSVVCQGLRSCLKPRLIEPIVLRHKLCPQISMPIPLPHGQRDLEEADYHDTIIIKDEEDNNIDNEDNNDNVNKNNELGGWNFLNALTNPTQFHKQDPAKTQKVYVHPVVKSTLSTKSLEMCTESLGSETGSDISQSYEEYESYSLEKKELLVMRKSREFSKKIVTSFPPPLTSISGFDGVRVKPHREGGRLVLKAVSVSSCGTNFQAERANGTLKLSLMINNCSMKCQTKMTAAMKVTYDIDNDCKYEDKVYEDDDEDEDDENEEGEVEGYCVGEDMDGNNGNVEGGNGIGEFSRPSRCKEGGSGRNKVMAEWRSFWVAIS